MSVDLPPRPRRQSSLHGTKPVVRRRQSSAGADREHGWSRAEDQGGTKQDLEAVDPARRPEGIPLLLLSVLAVLTAVGLAKVQAQTRVLELGGEITELSEERARLLDRKRRLETERAYLRHPDRIRRTATEQLGMEPVPPDRLQSVELLTNIEPPPVEEPDADPTEAEPDVPDVPFIPSVAEAEAEADAHEHPAAD